MKLQSEQRILTFVENLFFLTLPKQEESAGTVQHVLGERTKEGPRSSGRSAFKPWRRIRGFPWRCVHVQAVDCSFLLQRREKKFAVFFKTTGKYTEAKTQGEQPSARFSGFSSHPRPAARQPRTLRSAPFAPGVVPRPSRSLCVSSHEGGAVFTPVSQRGLAGKAAR